MKKTDFDKVIKNNLINPNDADDCFTYKIDNREYPEYYNKKTFDSFVNTMKDNYPEHYRKYREGKGSELIEKNSRYGKMPPKMASVASSSRFCYLALKDGTDALIDGRYITSDEVEFEKKCEIFKNSATSPHLDAYIADEKCDVYIEAKCHEIFDSHKVIMKAAYLKYFKDKNIFSDIVSIVGESEEDFSIPLELFGINDETTKLDIKQLICHLLGIAEQNKGKPVKLVYMFFKPVVDDKDVAGNIKDIFDELKEEIKVIFGCRIIREFCKANNIELMAIAEESRVMGKLTKENKTVLL